MYKIFTLSISLILILNLSAKDYCFIDNSIDKSEKIALVILNGIGDSKKKRKVQIEFFSNKGMDVYIPDYKERKSLEKSFSTFSVFYNNHELNNYKEVNFLCYIIGGYVLNRYIELHGAKNIRRIIYDRSPTQERAAKIGVDRLPFLSKIRYGQMLFDFSEIVLKPLSNDTNLEIGVIIENQATRLMRSFEKFSYKYGPYSFNINDIERNYDDFFHTWLDHNLMYTRFDVIGAEILYFYKEGHFTDNARRKKYDWDPFKKVRL